MRRHGRLAAGLGLLATITLAACGSDTGAASGSATDADASVDSPASSAAAGTSAAAADSDPGVVMALDDFAGIAALTLGVSPDAMFDVFGYESSAAILAAQGIVTAPYGAELDLEAVAAERPDVIIGVSIPTTVSVQEQLNQIAPTTVVEYTDSWQDQLRTVGEALGREDRAEELIAKVAADTEQLAGDLDEAGLSGKSVSVLAENGGMFSPPVTTGVGSVLADAGLTRPAAQQVEVAADSPFVQLSEETLSEHDADRIFLMSGGAYLTEPYLDSPLWESLGAVQRGDVSQVSAELWLASSAFATSWILDDLRLTMLDGAEAKSVDDAATAFADFIAS